MDRDSKNMLKSDNRLELDTKKQDKIKTLIPLKLALVHLRTNKMKTKQHMALSIVCKRMCCGSSLAKSQKLEERLYLRSEMILRERMDVIYYLKHLRKFDNFISLFINEMQNKSLKFFKKEVLSVNELKFLTNNYFTRDKDVENSEIQEINDHFKILAERDELTNLDEQIIENLNIV
jgi:hypothetical protein